MLKQLLPAAIIVTAIGVQPQTPDIQELVSKEVAVQMDQVYADMSELEKFVIIEQLTTLNISRLTAGSLEPMLADHERRIRRLERHDWFHHHRNYAR